MSVLVSETIDIEHVAYPHVKRRQGFILVVVRYVVDAVLKLPQIPDAVDHAVVRPEDRVESCPSHLPHVAAAPSVDAVVNVFELDVEIDEVTEIHQGVYLSRRGQIYRTAWITSGLARRDAWHCRPRAAGERVSLS